jgi:hypothetical protein
MSRWKAAGLHLLVSVVVGILTFSLIYFIWYPPPYFEVAGGSKLMLVIMGVDIVIGPVLTLAVFKAGKKGLRFDLAVIAILQICAFCYGIRAIALARPIFVVAEVDRYVLVTANQLDDEDLAAATRPEFRSRSWTGPRLVGAVPPQHGKETLDMVMSALEGKDIDRFPKYYVPYEEVAPELLKRSLSLDDVMKISALDKQIAERFLQREGGNIADYRCLPLQGRLDGYTMVVSQASGQPLTALPINPW